MNMIDLRAAPATDPTEIYRYRDGLYAADLLACALVHLDLFSWLAEHPASHSEICARFQIAERPTDVMLTLFSAMGLVSREQDRFVLTAQAREHLVQGSPWNLGPYFASLKDRPVCQDFLRVLRTDKPASWGSYKNEKDWHQAMEEPAFAESFTAAMDCRGAYLGQAMAKAAILSDRKALLDIAGGSGIYACTLVAHHPHLRAAVLEKPPVDRVAAAAIARRGFEDRVQVIASDMLRDPLPRGFDVHLFSNVLHDWNETTVEALLRQSWDALPPGGLLLVHDVHLNEDKTGPLPNAAYSAMLMHATQGKCYSLGEMRALLGRAGFDNMAFQPTAADRSLVSAQKVSR